MNYSEIDTDFEPIRKACPIKEGRPKVLKSNCVV